MQVPEKLALIGGSILLSSTLIFTLKSQASNILPQISKSTSAIFNHVGDTQKSIDFDNGFQQAQQKGWMTGQWGSSKYYIDDGMNMHVGKGTLQSSSSQGASQGALVQLIGDDKASTIKTLNFDQPVQMPANSESLFATNESTHTDIRTKLTSINGLNNVDTSQVTNMYGLFDHDTELNNLDLSNFDTSNVNDMSRMFERNLSMTNVTGLSHLNTSKVTNMQGMFNDDVSLKDIDLSHWDMDNVSNISWMFNKNTSLQHLNISNFNTSKVNSTDSFLGNSGTGSPINTLKEVDLGKNTILNGIYGFPSGNWKNGDQVIDVMALTPNSHAGSWIHQ